jgi:hypothetical protein
MAAPHSISTNYIELYSETTNNSFGTEEAEKDLCYEALYDVLRATTRALTVDVLVQNILADFSRPIGGIGVFVPDGTSITGVLEAMHVLTSCPGIPDQSRDWMKPFALLCDVARVDIATVAFDHNQLSVTVDVIVPGTIERVLQMLDEEPGNQMLGPFKASDVNVRATKARLMDVIPF